MSYVAFIEILKAENNTLPDVKKTIEILFPQDKWRLFGFEIDEYGSAIIDVGDSIYEDDLARLQALFDELCHRYPAWYVKLDWNGLEFINPDAYQPLQCLPGSTTPVLFDPYADDETHDEQGVA